MRSLKSIEENRCALVQKQEEDEDQLFGRHIAVTLRRLTSRQKAMAKLCIQQVLIDVEFPEETNVANCNSYFDARFPKTY